MTGTLTTSPREVDYHFQLAAECLNLHQEEHLLLKTRFCEVKVEVPLGRKFGTSKR